MNAPRILTVALLATALASSMTPARSAAPATADDTARFLAGLAPAPDSPLTALSKGASWEQHARYFDGIFGKEEAATLSKVRAFSQAQLNEKHDTMLYLFSGPDFLYATSFFPNASTYVLAGLEPVGDIPQLTALPRPAVERTLRNLEVSLNSILNISFFITKNMRTQLQAGPVYGTLPVLYVFLARTGKTIHQVSLGSLAEDGSFEAASEPGEKSTAKSAVNAAKGVKIVFSDHDGPKQTLYYFSTNLANDGVRRSGFLTFCDKLGPADSFIKSASYLLHGGGFSKVRDFLLDHSATILQDDSGIPLAYFDPKKWRLQPFGRYAGPISIFGHAYQSQMANLFHKSSIPIDFGLGYRWRKNESNLLLAQRIAPATSDAAAPGTSDAALTSHLPTDQYPRGTEARSPHGAGAAGGSTSHRKRAQRGSNRSWGCRTSGVFPFCSSY